MAKKIVKNPSSNPFTRSTSLSDDELNLLYSNASDIVDKYEETLLDIQYVDPARAASIVNKSKKNNPHINSIADIVKESRDFLKFYHAIKTQAELDVEFERAKKFVLFEGMDLPIIVDFDYQYFTEKYAIGEKLPTFYSWFNPDSETSYGKGAYHIAFPATQKYLTDDEVMVAMKHEWGHIFQGHCGVMTKDNFIARINNQAMDISINLGMTPEEQELLFSVARKIWRSPKACPCMSLAKPDGQGGFGVPVAVSPTDWVSTRGYIKAYYDKDKDTNPDGDGEEGDDGQAGGSGQGGGKQPPIDSKIKVGDFVYKAGTPPVYGKVTSINEQTGDVSYDEYTEDEWAKIKENIK